MVPSDELPDARDGLTRLQRDGLRAVGPGKRLRRGNRIFEVGPVPQTPEEYDRIEFHPMHDAMVRLGQPFVVMHPLIEGDGNFGSIDADPPAGAWWIDMRTTPIGRALLSESTPDGVLTGAFPTLLVNGSQEGLARFLPHNLREVAAALRARLDRPDLDLDGVMEHLPGPDFPTGGLLLDGPEIRGTYAIGRGEMRMRAKTLLGRQPLTERATVTVVEMPYLVTKGGEDGMIIEIASMTGDGLLPVGNIQDETDRHHGIRLVIEGRSDVNPEQLLRQLLATTSLHHTLEVRMLAEVDGAPRTLPLLAALDLHLETRRAHHRAAGVTDIRIDNAIRDELAELVERFGRDRRTEIVAAA